MDANKNNEAWPLARSTSDGSADYYFYYYYSYRRCTQRGPVDASSVNACHGEGRACGMLNLAVAVGCLYNSFARQVGRSENRLHTNARQSCTLKNVGSGIVGCAWMREAEADV